MMELGVALSMGGRDDRSGHQFLKGIKIIIFS